MFTYLEISPLDGVGFPQFKFQANPPGNQFTLLGRYVTSQMALPYWRAWRGGETLHLIPNTRYMVMSLEMGEGRGREKGRRGREEGKEGEGEGRGESELICHIYLRDREHSTVPQSVW